MNKQELMSYYVDIFNKKYDKCLEEENYDTDLAIENFEETSNTEEVVGYYIMYHKEHALKYWLCNTNGIKMSKQDKEVDKILKELFQ